MRTISEDELNRILKKHHEWVISHEKDGKQADLSNTMLSGKSFRNMVLIKAIFRGSDLTNADLTNSDCSWADFRKSNISYSSLRNAKFQYATFIHANLEGADLTAACFKNAVFKRTKLGGATIHDTSFVQARLINLDFRHVEIEDADLSGALLLNGKNIISSSWSEVVLSGIITDVMSMKDLPVEGRKKYGHSFVLVQPYAIVRSLDIPPQYKQAGLTILSYFARIIEQKYPNEDIAFSIIQQGNKVTLVIETDKEYKTIVEATLDLYEQVANRAVSPDDFVHTAAEVWELKTQLKVAEIQASFYKDMMEYQSENMRKSDIEIASFFKLVEHAHKVVEDPDPEYVASGSLNIQVDQQTIEDVALAVKLIRQYLHDLKEEISSPVNIVAEILDVQRRMEECCKQSGRISINEIIEDTGIKRLLAEIRDLATTAHPALDVTNKGASIIEKLVKQYNRIAVLLDLSLM